MTSIAKASPEKKASLILIPQAELDQIAQLDATVKEAHNALIQAEKDGNEGLKILVTARAVRAIQSLLTEKLMHDIMALMNNPLGFKTDKDPKRPTYNKETKKYDPVEPYRMEIVRDVTIQAMMRGLRMVGNEVNIIASNLYVTKEGYERIVREFPGLADLQLDIGVPALAGDGALVPARASWVLDGRPFNMVCERGEKPSDPDYRIPVRVNSAMGIDAIHGKAKSKLYRRIYERLTGTVLLSEEDTDGGDVLNATASEVKPAAITDGKQAETK